MATRIGDHIHSNVVGYIALFCFAMGGTAWATHPGGANTISSGDIINGEVRTGDIGDAEVKAADVAADSLGGAKIANGSVKNADLGAGASSSNTIADNGILGVDIQNNTLTGADMDEGTLFNDNSLTAADVDESTLASLWRFGGNVGTGAGDFLGTTDNQALECGWPTPATFVIHVHPDGPTTLENVRTCECVPLADLDAVGAQIERWLAALPDGVGPREARLGKTSAPDGRPQGP